MFRPQFVFVVLLVALCAFAPARAEEDEPTFLDKKLSYWLDLVNDGKDAKSRQRGLLAVEQIGHYGSRKVVPALVKSMREDKEDKVRASAARAVGRAIAKALEQARSDKKDELPRFETARDALAQSVRQDKGDVVREAAATAIGDIGPDARGAVGALAIALKDKHPGTVTAAAMALRRMGRDARDAESELIVVVGNAKAEMDARMESATALGQFSADVSVVLPTMRAVLEDAKTDVRLRRIAAESISKWGKDAADASATLGLVLLEKEPKEVEEREKHAALRLAAVTALDTFGALAKPAIPALVRAVADPDRGVRCLAMHAIGKSGSALDEQRSNAVKAIIKATEESNVEVCVTAIETLGALAADGYADQRAEVIKRLDEILKREGRKTIREAAQAARDKVDPPKKKEK